MMSDSILPICSTRFLFGAVYYGYEEDGAFAFGVGGEEAGDVVVEEGEAAGAEALGVSREIELAAQDAGFKLHGAIAAIAEALQDGAQVCEEKDVHGSVGGQLLLQSEVAGIGAEISLLQALKQAATAVEHVGSGREPFDGGNDHVEIIELSSRGIEEIRGHATRCAVQHGGKPRQGDRGPGEFAGRTAALDDLRDGFAGHFSIGQRLELHGCPGRGRKIRPRGVAAPRLHFRGGIERRGSVHFSHERIVHFALREGNGFEPKRRNFRRRWRRESRDAAESYEGESHFAQGIDIQKASDKAVHEAAYNLGRQTAGGGDGQQGGKQSAVVPAKMAAGSGLIFPGGATVGGGGKDSKAGVGGGGSAASGFVGDAAKISCAEARQSILLR